MRKLLKSYFIAIGSVAVFVAVGAHTFALADGAQTTRTPIGERVWRTLPNGREVSPVSGDMTTGAHITFIRFAPEMKTIPHTHSHDYVGIVVNGTARHYEPGKPETETVLPAGSHWAVPGNVVHISECLPGSACIFAIYQQAAFDLKPAK